MSEQFLRHTLLPIALLEAAALGQRADQAFGDHLAQPVQGKDDVPVLLEPGVVEIGGYMAHHEISGLDITGDHPVVIARIESKGPIVLAVQACGGDDGHSPSAEGWAVHPWVGLKSGA